MCDLCHTAIHTDDWTHNVITEEKYDVTQESFILQWRGWEDVLTVIMSGKVKCCFRSLVNLRTTK